MAESVIIASGRISDERSAGITARSPTAAAYHWPNAPASPEAKHSVAEHVDDLQALVPALGAAPAHLVGNSFGGLLCLLVAIRAPDLVRSLVLLEPFVLPLFVNVPPRLLELLKLALRHPRTAAAVVRFGARGLGPAQAAFERGDLEGGLQLFTRAVLGPGGVAQMTEARQKQARDNLETFASQLTRAEFPPMDPNHVRRITVPTLLLSGEQSPLLMRLLTDRLHELLPHAERVYIPAASHDAHVDNPSAVSDAVLTFLARRAQAQPTA